MIHLTGITHIMAEQGGDGFQAHAPVDRLGRQRVPELVRGYMADPGGAGSAADGGIDAGPGGWAGRAR